MTKHLRNSIDAGTHAYFKGCKSSTETVESDVLVDACAFDPTLDGFGAHFISREVEDEAVFILTFARLADECEDAVGKRDDDAAVGGMTFGFILLEAEQA